MLNLKETKVWHSEVCPWRPRIRQHVEDSLVEKEPRDVPVPKQLRHGRRVVVAHCKKHLTDRVFQARVVRTSEKAETAPDEILACLEGDAAVEVSGDEPVAHACAGGFVRDQSCDEHDKRGELVIERLDTRTGFGLGFDAFAHGGVVRVDGSREVVRECGLEKRMRAQEGVGEKYVGLTHREDDEGMYYMR
jgi:hypothetical protein